VSCSTVWNGAMDIHCNTAYPVLY